MKLTLKSVEWLNNVEKLELEKKEEENEESFEQIEDESVALMLAWKQRISEDSDKCTTCDCEIDFGDRKSIVEHYQSTWHRYNLKRRAKNLPILSEEDFEGINENDEETVSESLINYESDEDDIEACLLPSGRAFFVQNDNVFSISKSILHCDEDNIEKSIFLRSFDCLIILLNGGHFAAGIFENDRLVVHRSIHRYVARAKQGGVQSQYDGSHGNAKSAGAALRRYNEAKMREEIQQTLSLWKKKIASTPLIFLRCASYQKSIFFDAQIGIERGDPRLRTIPFETRRPTVEEVSKTWNRLQLVEEHGNVEKFKKELNEHRKKLVQKVEKKRKKMSEYQIGDWNENEENGKNRRRNLENGEEKKIDHLKQRDTDAEKKKAENDHRWPNLDDEFRKEMYKLIRIGEVSEITNRMNQINEDYRQECVDYLRNARFPPNKSSFLHISAAKSLKNVLNFLLEEICCDPTVKDELGRPPYSLSADKATKDVFVQFRVKYPEKFTWSRTHIPEPAKPVVMTVEEERKQAEKKKEKKLKQKEKAKAKKEEEKKEELERIEENKWINMSEREKRAEVLERRLAGLPPISRCQQCGKKLTENSFQYSHYRFCSTSCVANHRRANPEV